MSRYQSETGLPEGRLQRYQSVPLPWSPDALVGFLSTEQNNLHYNEHYLHYIKELNEAVVKGLTKGEPITQIMLEYTGRIADVAGQAWNHQFFWALLTPKSRGIPTGEIAAMIENQYGSFDKFKDIFELRVKEHFASGWVWLAYDPSTKLLMIIDGQDAYNPLKDGYLPLYTLDLWEHAFEEYEARGGQVSYVKNMWPYVNWEGINKIVQENITGSPIFYEK